MIIIRNANHNDVPTIAKFNSAMAMETEDKELDAGTVNRDVLTALKDKKHGYYLIAENVCGIRLYVDKNNSKVQQVYSKIGMTETNYLLFEEDWSSE